MRRVFISIGSNVEPQKNIPHCIEVLRQSFSVLNISSTYETDPVGPSGNAKFWNLAAEIETSLDTHGLHDKLREIEIRLGRKRGADKFAPRTIDIDLLPQADYQKQAFIMIPLAEIAPEVRDDETKKSFAEIAKSLSEEAARFKKIKLT
jgi:2-amino-4-hydroxy-6-hydroxymethyldihydropteridine diphosphokinase